MELVYELCYKASCYCTYWAGTTRKQHMTVFISTASMAAAVARNHRVEGSHTSQQRAQQQQQLQTEA
jgi:hypothetical protein